MRKLLIWLGVIALCLGAVFVTLASSLCRPRETANRVKCGSNLRQIGRAIALYATQNGGATPDSFKTLLKKEDFVPEILTCPSGPAERAESVEAFTDTEKDSSYLYCGDALPPGPIPDDSVLVVDRDTNHDHDGVNVLFGDGHVEFELIGNAAHAAPEWQSVQNQIARRVRPVRWQVATTQASY